MRYNGIDTISGKISRVAPRRSLTPSNRLQAIATRIVRVHTPGGMRLRQAAWVYPCALGTSFMPESASTATGVGWAIAGPVTADQRSFCNLPVSAAICSSFGLIAASIEQGALVGVLG